MSQSFGSGVGRHRPRPGGSPQQQQSNHNSTGYAGQQNHSTCHPPTPVQLSAPSADGCHRQQTQQLLQNVVGQLQASDRFHPSRQLPLGGQHSQRDDNNPPGAGLASSVQSSISSIALLLSPRRFPSPVEANAAPQGRYRTVIEMRNGERVIYRKLVDVP